MRLKTIFKTIRLCALLLGLGLTCQAQWNLVGSKGFSAGYVNYVDLAFDSNDTPYVAYQDFGNSAKSTVMKYNGSSWAAVGSAGFSPSSASHINIALGNNDTPYIAYVDASTNNKIAVLKYNGSSWVNVGSAGFSDTTAWSPSFALDGNNTPYVAYSDGPNSSKVTAMKYDGNSWDTVGSVGFSAGSSSNIKLAFDSNDTPYVAYTDGGNSNKATVMKYNGSSWVVVGSAGFTSGTAFWMDFSINTNDIPYVVFQDGANSNKLTVMKYNGSSWAVVGSAGFTQGNSPYSSIAFDSTNTPYVSYVYNSAVYVYHYNGSSWSSYGNTVSYGSGSAYTSLVFNSTGTPYIAFRDGSTNPDKTSVYGFLPNFWNGSTWSQGTPSSSDDAYISSNTTPGSFTCDNLFINNGYALNTGTSNTVTVTGNITNNGNGVTGSGTLHFNPGFFNTSYLYGDTLECEATITVASASSLSTNNKLRLISNATNTGRIGNSAGTISGNVYVQRYMPGKRCFRFYGHPFSSSIALNQLTDEIDITGTGGATNGFTTTTSNNPSAFWFDVSAADTVTSGANAGWTAFTSANTASWDRYELLRLMIRGAKGEGLAGGSYTPSAATFEGVGAVNQGTQVVTLTKGSGSNFVSCGNPFPSPVQMNTVAKGSNIGANYYVWDATSGSKGAYVTNAFTLDYKLPAYAALFTTASANSNNTLTFEEADKAATGAGVFKTTGPNDWVELYIYDSTTKWDRLLINLNSNGMEVEDKLDGKKLYNPGLDFFTLSDDNVRLAVDVRPYDDQKSIPLGLTAYNRYNKYVIRTGMFNIPAGTKLVLHDKYLNTQKELKQGFEYWFDVTSDTASQGNNRFEINMVGKPTNIIEATNNTPQIQLIPNPARDEVKVSFKAVEGTATVKLMSITGQVLYSQTANAGTGSVTIPLVNIPLGIYMVNVESNNVSYTEKLIKE